VRRLHHRADEIAPAPHADLVEDAVATIVDPASIRWISSGHASRPDEYGALDEWESVASSATAAHGRAGCFLCLSDMSSRPPRPLADGEVIDVGGHRLQWIDNYGREELLDRLVLAVVNFPPRQIGPFWSEVLTLGTYRGETVLLVSPDAQARPGDRLG
jgi:hypothetical protein